MSRWNVSNARSFRNQLQIRDDGPFFVQNVANSDIEIIDMYFNGWGGDEAFQLDNQVPLYVSEYLDMYLVNETGVELEGGAIEVDGRGTMMATKSSVLENGRNPDLTQAQVEEAITEYLGVQNFIWLDGAYGGRADITDYHIDGFARFGNSNTIVTMSNSDLLYWGISQKDADTLFAATDMDGNAYNFLELPLSQNNVVTTYGEDLGFRGSYVNFYTGNSVVLIPSYNDPMDEVARTKLQTLYPDRTVVSIPAANVLKNGGMIHCVTKQEAAGTTMPQTPSDQQMIQDELDDEEKSAGVLADVGLVRTAMAASALMLLLW